MIQEKYNRQIFDEGSEEAIVRLSHLRSNVLSPVGITSADSVLICAPDSVSMVEWLQEVAGSVTVVGDDEPISGSYSLILNIGKLTETPSVLKSHLSDGGRLVYALPDKDGLAGFTKKLLGEAGFTSIETFRVSPDYLFTTEIYSEDYIGEQAGDYLLIAK